MQKYYGNTTRLKTFPLRLNKSSRKKKSSILVFRYLVLECLTQQIILTQIHTPMGAVHFEVLPPFIEDFLFSKSYYIISDTELPLIRLVARSFVSHRQHLCLSHSDTINALSRGHDSKGWPCVWEGNLRPPPALEYGSPPARCPLCRGPRLA